MSDAELQRRGFHLLALAKNIRHYEEALSAARGEGFNLFNILRVGHYEVRTHSPLLAELLNPQGSHGQGAAFLKHFLTRLKLHSLDAESAHVSTEYHIGPQTEQEGGRLDILLRDSTGVEILIENKIHAGLQRNQLARYRNFSSRGTLLFLTLNGDPPEKTTTGNSLNLRCISYRSDIVGWLQDCRKEAAVAPCVRETITQYIHLIQELTQQNTSARMNQELIKAVLHDKESFLAYTALCKAENAIRADIMQTLVARLNTIAMELGLKLEPSTGDLSGKFGGFTFSSPQLKQCGFGICFEFGKSGYQECYFGFYYLDELKKSKLTSKLQEAFKLEFGQINSNSDLWPASLLWEQHQNWTDTTFAAIQFGNFADDFKKLLQRLVAVANRACAVPRN